MFKALDLVISEAGRRNIKVILALGDWWQSHGGVNEYVGWSHSATRRACFVTLCVSAVSSVFYSLVIVLRYR
jgi:hypothetical protein